jgi:hypothetical protein
MVLADKIFLRVFIHTFAAIVKNSNLAALPQTLLLLRVEKKLKTSCHHF